MAGLGTVSSAANNVLSSVLATLAKVSSGIGLDGNAKLLAHRVIDRGAQRHRLVGIFGDDAQRQHDLVVIAERMAAGAVIELGRRRPQNGHGLDIVRFGKVEAWRHAGISSRAPIGFPSRLQLEGDAAEQHRAAARTRQQPDRGVSIPQPGRRILGARLDRERRQKQDCGEAERGAHGNHHDHARLYRQADRQTIELLVMYSKVQRPA